MILGACPPHEAMLTSESCRCQRRTMVSRLPRRETKQIRRRNHWIASFGLRLLPITILWADPLERLARMESWTARHFLLGAQIYSFIAMVRNSQRNASVKKAKICPDIRMFRHSKAGFQIICQGYILHACQPAERGSCHTVHMTAR